LAAIDLSDGMADAARRLAEGSGIGVVINGAALPIHEAAAGWAAEAGHDPVLQALAGGEDYELAFAVAAKRQGRFRSAMKRCPDLAVTHVGTFVREPGAWLDRNGQRESLPTGFGHF
jgi:thiamine monophosphate kinase